MMRCNTCNAGFDRWTIFVESGQKVERCPACNNTKQMSDAAEPVSEDTKVWPRGMAPEPKIHTGKPGVSGGGLVHDGFDPTKTLLEDKGGIIEEVARGITFGRTHPFQHITSEMYHLYLKKNHDYGNSFSIQYQELGMASSIIRLSDKLSRLKSLHGKPQQVSDESIRDTLIDLANYAVMTIMELDRETAKPETVPRGEE